MLIETLILTAPLIAGLCLRYFNSEIYYDELSCDICGSNETTYNFESYSFTPVNGEEISSTGLRMCLNCAGISFQQMIIWYEDEFKNDTL